MMLPSIGFERAARRIRGNPYSGISTPRPYSFPLNNPIQYPLYFLRDVAHSLLPRLDAGGLAEGPRAGIVTWNGSAASGRTIGPRRHCRLASLCGHLDRLQADLVSLSAQGNSEGSVARLEGLEKRGRGLVSFRSTLSLPQTCRMVVEPIFLDVKSMADPVSCSRA